MQGRHEHFRKPKAHRLNWGSKKLNLAVKEEERAEDASDNIPSLGMSLPQRFHETIRHHHFKPASPSKEEKKEESRGEAMPNLGLSLPRTYHKTIHEHEFDTSKHRLKTGEGSAEPELGMGIHRENPPKKSPEKQGEAKKKD